MDTLGKRLRYLRKSILKTTQEEMAEKIGFSDGYISKIEKDKSDNPTDRPIDAICRVYSVNKEWLLTGEGPIHADAQPTDMEKLEAIMSGKSEVKKSFIRALADMPEALLDEMLPYLRKAVAELDRR